MHTGSAVPNVKSGTALVQALYEVSQKRLGMTLITDNNQHLLGIFTDGDLRRAIDQGLNLQATLVDQVMTSNSKTINKDILAAEALRIMEDNKITTLIIVDKEKKPLGVVHIHDILSQRIT
jgi:arabinose-5-phosphate isomerase